MESDSRLRSAGEFSAHLFRVMKRFIPGLKRLELFEFCYAMENMIPDSGWDPVAVAGKKQVEQQVGSRSFYQGIQLHPRRGDRIVLDEQILHLNRMLFAGLARGEYSPEWVNSRFYFDLRGFYFLPRTEYFSSEVLKRLGGKPWRQFEPKQVRLASLPEVGYKDFKAANAEIDRAFIDATMKIVQRKGTPILVTIAGPTAAGKTEITERLKNVFKKTGRRCTTIEVDNFLIDRALREDKPMGRESTHFGIFLHSLEQTLQGKRVQIPRYDFILATSSHNLDGSLKAGCTPIVIEPADVVFMEGNFPFHTPEIASLVGIRVVYLTDDPIRLKRKWKRDIDYRKKYDPEYFRNRFFRTQFLRAEDLYRPLMAVCDLVVDTTSAALWANSAMIKILESS